MIYRRNVFLIIGILYLISKIVYSLLIDVGENSVVLPGWHTTIEYRVVYNDWFTPVFFLAIAVIYSLAKQAISNKVFWTHVVISVIPLLSLAIWPTIFSGNRYDIDELLTDFRAMKAVEYFFILSQLILIGFLLIKNSVHSRLRTT